MDDILTLESCPFMHFIIGKEVTQVDSYESKIDDFYDLCLNSSLIISNDTGPAHIAGLTNQHLIWLANDNKISFSCHPLGKNVHRIKSKNVKDIHPNQVIQKIDYVLNI